MRSYLQFLAVVVFGFAVVSLAWAVPAKFTQQGRLLDTSGQPLTGTHSMQFRLFDSEQGGAELWTEQHETSFQDGYYTVTLGTVASLDASLFDGATRWLELSVDGESLSPRQELTSVPYALHATSAQRIEGGSVDAVEVAVDGTAVINGSGQWVGPPLDWTQISNVPSDLADGDDNQDTLTDLAALCLPGDVAKWNDTPPGGWECAPDTDTTLAETEVESMVTNSPLDLHGSTTIGGSPLLSSTTCNEGELLAYSGGNWVCTSFQTLLDSDGDGSLVWNDCDDTDPGVTDQQSDNDCDGAPTAADCDDTDPANFSGNTEVCDGQDNDCDGLADFDTDGEVDNDGDGALACDNDCDDSDPDNYPGNSEQCDGQDNDCTGGADFVTAEGDGGGEADSDGDNILNCIDCADLDPDSSCLQGTCLEVLNANPSAGDGIYWLDPDGDGEGGGPVEGYCDMTTDGGGWTLMLAYDHAAGTNPSLTPSTLPTSPTSGSSHIYLDELGLPSGSVASLRFYCTTSAHTRVLHFRTENAPVLAMGFGAAGSTSPTDWSTGYTSLSGHTANLPAATSSTNQGPGFAGGFTFFVPSTYHWAIKCPGGPVDRWECDDPESGGTNHDTLHQVWFR